MKFTKFELVMIFGMMLGWVQLMFGFIPHAFYSLGVLMLITLMGIMEYLRSIYMGPK